MHCKHCGRGPDGPRLRSCIRFVELHPVAVGPTIETELVPADAGLFCSRDCLRDYLATPLPEHSSEWLRRALEGQG